MASMPPQLDPVSRVVVAGIDTHKDLHVAAVVDTDGVVLGTESFSTTRAGYRAMVRWMRTFGDVRKVGVEGTGSYGAGITRHLTEAGIEVLEVDRPDRADRRRRGKSDTLDAEAAALAALAGRRTSIPKRKDGLVESLLVLRLTRATAIRSRTKALQLLRMHVISAPEELRDQVRNLTRMQLLRTWACWRPDTIGFRDPVVATRIALKSLARRILELNDEIATLDELINPLVAELAPRLLARPCIGVEIAGQILVILGDNPARIRTEAASPCCAASPRCPPPPARPNATASTAAGTAKPTGPCTWPPSPACAPTTRPRPTSPARPPRATPSWRSSAASFGDYPGRGSWVWPWLLGERQGTASLPRRVTASFSSAAPDVPRPGDRR